MLRSSLSHSIRLLACVAEEKLLSCLHAIFLYIHVEDASQGSSQPKFCICAPPPSPSPSTEARRTTNLTYYYTNLFVSSTYLNPGEKREKKNRRHFISGDRLKMPGADWRGEISRFACAKHCQQRTSDTDCATVTLTAIKCTKAKTGQSA